MIHFEVVDTALDTATVAFDTVVGLAVIDDNMSPVAYLVVEGLAELDNRGCLAVLDNFAEHVAIDLVVDNAATDTGSVQVVPDTVFGQFATDADIVPVE